MNAPTFSEPLLISKTGSQLPTQSDLQMWLCAESLCVSAQALLRCEELFTSSHPWLLMTAVIIIANISYMLMEYQAQL